MSDKDKTKKEELYYTEALIKEVAAAGVDQVSFKLEPPSPYVFEKRKNDGTTKRCLLFVDEIQNPCEAKIVSADQDFTAPNPVDFHALLIAKANRMKMRVTIDMKWLGNNEEFPLTASKLELM